MLRKIICNAEAALAHPSPVSGPAVTIPEPKLWKWKFFGFAGGEVNTNLSAGSRPIPGNWLEAQTGPYHG